MPPNPGRGGELPNGDAPGDAIGGRPPPPPIAVKPVDVGGLATGSAGFGCAGVGAPAEAAAPPEDDVGACPGMFAKIVAQSCADDALCCVMGVGCICDCGFNGAWGVGLAAGVGFGCCPGWPNVGVDSIIGAPAGAITGLATGDGVGRGPVAGVGCFPNVGVDSIIGAPAGAVDGLPTRSGSAGVGRGPVAGVG